MPKKPQKEPAMIPPPQSVTAPTALSPRDQQLMDKAKELETSFLSEMLNYAGLDNSKDGFFGSSGEDQFGSFLRDAQARQMVDKGGIGLAETLFHSLSRMQDEKG
jgi:Rod binding domain-containing protein